MPTLTENVSFSQQVEVDFEVYCAECGAGICSNASVKKTYNRGANRVDIEACSCMTNRIKELEDQLKKYEVEE